MRHSLIFLILFLHSFINIAQTFENEQMRYWYYRDRLQYFVYPGNDKGNSVIATYRNQPEPRGDQWVQSTANAIKYGQTYKLMGYYLGLLATEYKLLQMNNQDVSKTRIELDLALDALIRMDNCEMDAPWYQSRNYFDGFFIRSDVPPILSQNMVDNLNIGLSKGDLQDYRNQINNGYAGLPFEILPTHVNTANMYEDPINQMYIIRSMFLDQNGTDFISEYNLHQNIYMNYWKNGNFISNDEIVGVYMGLALVGKLVDDIQVKAKASSIATRILDYAVLDPRAYGIYGHSVVSNVNFDKLEMRYPNLDEIIPDNGGKTIGVIHGVSSACEMNFGTTSLFYDNQTRGLSKQVYSFIINELVAHPGPLPMTITVSFIWGGQHTFEFKFMHEYDRGMFCKLLAISDKSNLWISPEKAIRVIGANNDWETFYLPLWAVINDKDLTKNKYKYPFEKLIDDMQSAPCGGPYDYGLYNGDFPDGWCSQYKYDCSLSGQHTGGDETGVFPGIDYMLLYNLACLAFPNGFDYNGQTYRFPYYVNLNDRHDIHAIYPYTYVYSMQGAHMDPLGSTIHPEEIRAISTIESSMIVTTTCDVLYSRPQYANNSYEIDGIGDVTLIAGESIRLTDGFRVDAGAHFLAKIESYSCNGLPYKNMNAPPWDENYRASFYDTLISVPRDQRAPIVYNDDDYGYEDYDEPLWDDYYYQYPDTGSTPDLPLTAFLNPNPCTSRTVLQIVPGSDVFVKIELYDISGQKREELYEGNTGTSAFDLEIDMSTYSQGVYILRIIGNGAVKTFKLMRE